MSKIDNYQIQVQQAQARFLTYDQESLIQKLGLKSDEQYLYISMLAQTYRIHRKTGSTERLAKGLWRDANSHGEVMTLLDFLCDCREDRYISGRWKNMLSFGLMFHQNLLEDSKDSWAEKFQNDPEGLRRACLALGGETFHLGDVAYAIELFDGLRILVQLWLGDDEFPPNLRFLWDENALMYIRYETMYFAKGMLLRRLEEEMGT